MKVKCLGTGTLTTERALSSFLIDDDILFDIGSGTIREMQKYQIDTSKIKSIIISHYHTDHLSDLPTYIVRRSLLGLKYGVANAQLTIVGPPDIEAVVGKIRDIYSSGLEHLWDFPKLNIKFTGLDSQESYDGEDISVTAYPVKHGSVTPCSGYVIRRGGVTLGFSGDAAKCEGLDKIVELADAIFVDANGPEPDPMGFHLGLTGVLEYARQYPDKKFYLIHRGDYKLPDLPGNVFAPDDGEEIEP
jgi:ribonuclease Z